MDFRRWIDQPVIDPWRNFGKRGMWAVDRSKADTGVADAY